MSRSVEIIDDPNEDELIVNVSNDFGYDVNVTRLPYGFVLSEPGFAEWQITVLVVGRQDGMTSWHVALTMIDSETSYLNGFAKSDRWTSDVESALYKLTSGRGWIEPINAY